MQFQLLAATAFFAGLAAAAPQQDASLSQQQQQQLLAKLPSCSLPCLQEGSTKVGCAAGDFACTCTKMDALTQAILPCVSKACKPEELVCMFTPFFILFLCCPTLLPALNCKRRRKDDS